MAPKQKSKQVYQVWKGKNRFLCGGRCMFGPDVATLLLTIFLITSPVITFSYQIISKIQNQEKLHQDLIHAKHSHVFGIPVLIVTIILMIADWTFLLLTSSTDPGIVPRNNQSIESSEASDYYTPSIEWINGVATQMRMQRTKDVIVNGYVMKVKYCDTCLLYRPPRTSHCSICNNCVQKFDHHCPWVGQCIGLRNYRFFLLFVSTSTFLCIYVFTLSVVNILQERKNYHSYLKLIVGEIISVILIVYTFLCVWFVGGLTVFHLYLICTNQTTYENFRYHFDKNDNPFNKGVLGNFKEVFSNISPSMIKLRSRVLDQTAENRPHPPNIRVDAVSSSDKVDVETAAVLEEGINLTIPSLNLDYISINENQGAINENKGGEALDPSDSAKIQENNHKKPMEYDNNCTGEDETEDESVVPSSVHDEDAHQQLRRG